MRYIYSLVFITILSVFFVPFTLDYWLTDEIISSIRNQGIEIDRIFFLDIIFFVFIFSLFIFCYLISKDKELNSKISLYLDHKLSKVALNQFDKVYETTYLSLIALSFTALFLLFSEKTVLEWTTLGEIPILLRLDNPNYLLNDFFTNAVIESPKIIFSYLVSSSKIFGVSWLASLYLMKILLIVLIPVLLFKIYLNISILWAPKDSVEYCNQFIHIFIFFCSFGFIGLLQFYTQMYPFGWGSIEFGSIDPMRTSFFFGLIYFCLESSKKTYPRLLSLAFLFFSCLLHPIIGLSVFFMSSIFLLPIEFNKKRFLNSLTQLIIGVVVPITFMSVTLDNESFLSPSEFKEIYVNLRHPHHYLISEIFSIYSVMWIGLLSIPIFISKFIDNKRLLILSSTIFISVVGSVIIQYIFTEIHPVKLILKIGPTRFTSFCSIMFTMNLIALIPHLFANAYHKPLKKYFYYKLIKLICIYCLWVFSSFQKLIFSSTRAVILLLFLIFSAFFFTYNDDLNYMGSDSDNQIASWLKENTPEDAVIFSAEFDPYIIRINAERAVYADFSFPFSEKYMKDFASKFIFYKKSRNFKLSDYACAKDIRREIKYIILKNEIENRLFAIYSNKDWSVFELEEILCAN